MFPDLRTCPCCGYKTISDEYEACIICCWKYDLYQNSHPDDAGGPNMVSLREAQRNFAEFGAKSGKYRDVSRLPGSEDVRDPAWRPVT